MGTKINDWDKKIARRPKCACKHEMKLIHYQGYYESFKFWECYNKDCKMVVDNLQVDDEILGSYA